MYNANIRKQHMVVFNDRLQKIQATLDRAKEILFFKRETVENNIFISKECAAWLVGRIDTYDDINIYIIGQNPAIAWLDEIVTGITNEPNSQVHVVFNKLMFKFTYKGASTLKFTFTSLDTYDAVKRLFDFEAAAVFINLFDTNIIKSCECRCDYELNCIVTKQGCMSHGSVVYPLLLNSDDLSRMEAYNKLSDEQKQLIHLVSMGKSKRYYSTNHTTITPKRLIKYATRLLTDSDLYKDRIMTFCDYSCPKCKTRDKLTKKYFDLWKHKTYAPNGYGYKVALEHFKGIDPDLVKQYCTCSSTYSAAKY